jgi:predicted permease
MLSRRRAAREAAEEWRFHLDREIETHVARGLPPSEARRAALRDLGGLLQTTDAVRDVRTFGVEALWRDVRVAVRALVARRRFGIVAMLTLVVLVAGLTTIFAFVDAVLLRPLPYPSGERLVAIAPASDAMRNITLAEARRLSRDSPSLEAWALFRTGSGATLDATTNPTPVAQMRVTPSVFAVFGIPVVVGRPLVDDDGKPGAPDAAVIGYDVWQSHFDGSPDVIGTLMTLGDRSWRIVGVAASGADVPGNRWSFPIVWQAAKDGRDDDGTFDVVARMRTGASLRQTRAELARASARVEQERRGTPRDRALTVTPLRDAIVGDAKHVLWIFFAAVCCVALIGIGNLIGLQLVRQASRERETALRAALGAGRWQLVRPVLVEAVLFGGAAGACGLLLAWLCTRTLLSALPAQFPRADQIAVDVRVTMFAVGASLVIGAIIGAVPAWRASRRDIARTVRAGGHGVVGRGHRNGVRRGMVAAETALACVLLVGAALLVNSFGRLFTEDAGMRERDLWIASGQLPQSVRYMGQGRALAWWTSALEAVRQLPDVESAALAVNSGGPLSGFDIMAGRIAPAEAALPPPGGGLRFSSREIGAGFFETAGIPIAAGRSILPSDTAGTELIAVLNTRAASMLWPGGDPIGRQVRISGRPRTVVGVIPTFKISRLDGEPSPQVYTPYLQGQSPAGASTILIRARGGDGDLPTAIGRVLGQAEPDLHLTVSTMGAVRWKLLAAERFRTFVLSTFAVTAVGLALIGVGGLVAASVVQRYREIAVRLALGATHTQVARVVMREATVPAVVGLASGLLIAGLTTRVLTAFLFGVRPLDPWTFGVVAAVLAAAVLLASLLPARRVARIDPLVTLRHE